MLSKIYVLDHVTVSRYITFCRSFTQAASFMDQAKCV